MTPAGPAPLRRLALRALAGLAGGAGAGAAAARESMLRRGAVELAAAGAEVCPEAAAALLHSLSGHSAAACERAADAAPAAEAPEAAENGRSAGADVVN